MRGNLLLFTSYLLLVAAGSVLRGKGTTFPLLVFHFPFQFFTNFAVLTPFSVTARRVSIQVAKANTLNFPHNYFSLKGIILMMNDSSAI